MFLPKCKSTWEVEATHETLTPAAASNSKQLFQKETKKEIH